MPPTHIKIITIFAAINWTIGIIQYIAISMSLPMIIEMSKDSYRNAVYKPYSQWTIPIEYYQVNIMIAFLMILTCVFIFIGMWHMRKWAMFGYIIIGLSIQFFTIFIGIWTLQTLMLYSIICMIGLSELKNMTWLKRKQHLPKTT